MDVLHAVLLGVVKFVVTSLLSDEAGCWLDAKGKEKLLAQLRPWVYKDDGACVCVVQECNDVRLPLFHFAAGGLEVEMSPFRGLRQPRTFSNCVKYHGSFTGRDFRSLLQVLTYACAPLLKSSRVALLSALECLCRFIWVEEHHQRSLMLPFYQAVVNFHKLFVVCVCLYLRWTSLSL